MNICFSLLWENGWSFDCINIYFISAGFGLLAFLVNKIKVLSPICTLTWRVNNYVSRSGKGKNRRKESKINNNPGEYVSNLTNNWLWWLLLVIYFNILSVIAWNSQKSQNNSVLTVFENFSFKRWQHYETSESWQLWRETQEFPMNSQSQDPSVPGITENYDTEISEEIEGRVTEKLSQEFSKTESRILGAESKLDEFLLNPQIRTRSGTFPVTFPNIDIENREPTGDRSQGDPYPAVVFPACRTSTSVVSDPKETSHNYYY